MTRLEIAIDQIIAARLYTQLFIHDLEPDDWFRQPTEGVTHIAWQLGHLAMAQYRLTLERLRGIRSEDDALISADFLKRFARDSVPNPDPASNPTPAEILEAFGRVYEQALAELPLYADAELDQPPLSPHPLFDTKFDSLLWCARHEMLHAGQIGLLRRLLGKKPRW
jgi:hypothetical protein